MDQAHHEDRASLIYLRVDELTLDTRNPRLVTAAAPSQKSLLRQLYEQESLDELAQSFVDNGYFAEEPLVVVKENGEWVVVEGNRRLATLKLLLDESLRADLKVDGWPELSIAQRDRIVEVPCVKYDNREEVFPFLGFRHITGAKKWAPFQKARFIAQLIDAGRSLDEVEDLIGDNSQTVKKLYQDYIVFNQIKTELDMPERPIRDRFSLLESDARSTTH
ncbi:ParB N-terminal domain-containing protein [Microbacterium sp. BR1]|uniref:ParB N-terminal domain-containing protein n=1 Tax=Microbacterium sp. BR1 TaxID=1070896 RepID=UPI000C2B7B7F|nr:ParB N-terminal domain-containing protein [Microbacterium sp. BR1]